MMTDGNTSGPVFVAPSGSCDSHFHVFGPLARYPVGADLRYVPPVAPLSDYLDVSRALNLDHYVFVQPSAYGRDNSCMLDAMREVDPGIRRGVVDIDEDAPDSLLAELDGLGVRGVRINVSPIKPFEPGFGETLKPRIARLADRCGEIGWHLDFLLPGWLTDELMPVLETLRLDFTLAHLGMHLAKDGPAAPGYLRLLNLLKNGEGHAWVKTTGVYRFSKVPGSTDARPMVEAALAAAPGRVLYGSDYPHLSFPQENHFDLFNLLLDWFPDAATRRQVLVDNPHALYRFER